jgi:hypothetical protein
MIKFSSGNEAQVLLDDVGDSALRGAELVRVSCAPLKAIYPFLKFYESKLAALFFPGSVVSYRAVRFEKEEFSPGYASRLVYHLSNNAPVPSDHSVYSDHMMVTMAEGKISRCHCPSCSRHREFHSINNLESQAYLQARTMEPFGFWMPADDSSDYCLTDSGQILFFEIDEFDPYKCLVSLRRSEQPSGVKKRAEKILNRHMTISGIKD